MTLEKQELQKLLFRTAFCVMACDGEIHPDEIKEIKKMNKSSAYFQGIDFSDELDFLIVSLKTKGKFIIEDIGREIQNAKLSTVQELLLLEIILRMIYADNRVDENEIKLLRYFRSKLNLHDQTIRDRFGAVEYLFDKDYSQDIIRDEIKDELFASITIPDFKEIIEIDFSDLKNE